jgi:hypothetical protein
VPALCLQILLEPITFKGIHNKLEEMDVTELDVSDLSTLVNQVRQGARTRVCACVIVCG